MKQIIAAITLLSFALLHAFAPIERISKPEELRRLQQTAKLMNLIKNSPELFDLLKQTEAPVIISTLHAAIAGLVGAQVAVTYDYTREALARRITLLQKSIKTDNNVPTQEQSALEAQPELGILSQPLTPRHSSGKRKYESLETDSETADDELHTWPIYIPIKEISAAQLPNNTDLVPNGKKICHG